MSITIDTGLLTLLVTGLISGTASAAVAESAYRSSRRFWLRNLVIGVLGAVLGVFLFDALGLVDDLPAILAGTITLAELFIAFIGGVLLILLARAIR